MCDIQCNVLQLVIVEGPDLTPDITDNFAVMSQSHTKQCDKQRRACLDLQNKMRSD